MINRILLTRLESLLNTPKVFQQVFGKPLEEHRVGLGRSSKRKGAWYLSVTSEGLVVAMLHTRGNAVWLKYYITDVPINDCIQVMMAFNAVATLGVVNCVKSPDVNNVSVYYETKLTTLDLLLPTHLAKVTASIVLEAVRVLRPTIGKLYVEEVREGRMSEFFEEYEDYEEDVDDEDDGDGAVPNQPKPNNLS